MKASTTFSPGRAAAPAAVSAVRAVAAAVVSRKRRRSRVLMRVSGRVRSAGASSLPDGEALSTGRALSGGAAHRYNKGVGRTTVSSGRSATHENLTGVRPGPGGGAGRGGGRGGAGQGGRGRRQHRPHGLLHAQRQLA